MNSIKRMIFILLVGFSPTLLLAKVDKLRCMWRTDPSTTVVIGWNQISGSSPEVCYGEIDGGSDTNYYPSCAQPARFIQFKGMNNYFVRLENLTADRAYFFIIVDSEGVSRRYSFKTASNNPDARLSIVAGGDSRNYRNARQRANQMVAKLRPDVVMFGGDMTGGDSDWEWKQWLDDWQMTISADGRITPILATRGNHEFSNQSITDIFDVPSQKVYYRLTLGGNLLDIYTLNSLIASGGDQKLWLEEELNRPDQAIWKMAQYHYAIRPHTARKTERNNQLSNWGKLFYKHQMNLVVESDAHCVKTTWPIRPSAEPGNDEGFIRDDLNGTIYVGEGCWGAPLRKNNDDKAWTRNSGSFNQFKWIFVDRAFMEVRTVRTDNADQVASVEEYDRFNPPAGIDIWNPSHGPVIRIPNRNNSFQTELASSTYNKESSFDVLNLKALVTREGVQLTWKSLNPQKIPNSYLIQRQKADGEFETLAKVEGTGSKEGTFNIMDMGAISVEKPSYRLVCSTPGKKSTVTPFKLEQAIFNATLVKQPVSSKRTKTENKPIDLAPDANSGYLRVKYTLGEQSNVFIQLVKESSEMSSSNYQNQREGNYLKSIDMSEMPDGQYELIIKVNEEILHEYIVRK